MDTPLITIIIPVRDMTGELRCCLDSISRQNHLKHIDVLVVDDGSRESIAQMFLDWSLPFPVQFLSQRSSGVSAARNLGIRHAKGQYLLFMDSDCEMAQACLSNLITYINSHENPQAMQLKITGHKKTLAGKMFHLRISATFDRLSDGKNIRIVNTSGFAIHRSVVDRLELLFDPDMKRGEDTKILAQLIQVGLWPQYVEAASIHHVFYTPTVNYLFKHFIRGYYTVPARNLLSETAPVLMDRSQKVQLIAGMRRIAEKENISSAVIVLVIIANCFEIFGRMAYKVLSVCKRVSRI